MLAKPTQDRQSWLDGLRGVAAAIVALFHFTVDVMRVPFHQYWEQPPEKRHLIQLTPFRLIFCGQAMVRIFFVISGYSVSISILRHRDPESGILFYQKLSSSVLRRIFRLYVPVFVLCLFSHAVFYTGLYTFNFEHAEEGCPEVKPWGPVRPHLSCMIQTFLTSMSLLKANNTMKGLNGHLWSMADEIKGSLAVYVAILCLARVQTRARLTLTCIIGFILLYCGFPHTSGFIAGLLFAELDLLKQQDANSIPTSTKERVEEEPSKWRWWKKKTTAVALLMFSTTFLCLPVLKEFPTDYWFRLSFNPTPFWEAAFKRIDSFHTIGAVVLIAALRHLPTFRRVALDNRPVQFLGKISFSFFLYHQVFSRTMRKPILNFVCQSFLGKDIHATRDDEAGAFVYYLAWLVAGSIIVPIDVLAASYATKTVDRYSVTLAHKVEKRLTAP